MDRLNDLGLAVARPSLDDAQRIFDLIHAIDMHDFGAVDMSADEVRDELADTDLQSDAWLVLPADAPDGEPVAMAAMRERAEVQHQGQVSVHPEWRRRGIGSALAGAMEERAASKAAAAPEGRRVTLVGWVKADSSHLAWARGLGYDWARRFLRMRIDMTEPPPAPVWPDGILLRRFVPGRDERDMYEAQEQAFSDHWGHLTMRFEKWVKRTEHSDFDPELWLIAVDGDRVVATSTNSVSPDNAGWISGLGVVRSHRRRGLARAILLQAFGDFWRRGQKSVSLGVDADSLTGATRLYESVGMRIEEQFDQVRKVLREGEPAETAV